MMGGPLALAALRGVLREDLPLEVLGRFFGAPWRQPEALALALHQVTQVLPVLPTRGYRTMEHIIDALMAAGIPPGGPDDPHCLQLLFCAETHALWLAVDRVAEGDASVRSTRMLRMLNARATAVSGAHSVTWALRWLFETEPAPLLCDLDAALARLNAFFSHNVFDIAEARVPIERACAAEIRRRAVAVAMIGSADSPKAPTRPRCRTGSATR